MRPFSPRFQQTVFCTALLVSASGLAAQSRPPASSLDSTAAAPGDTLAARLATITTDTGAFAPGHRDWSHYDNPGLCLEAARLTYTAGTNTLAAQAVLNPFTHPPTLGQDTLGSHRTMAVAQACGAHFTLASLQGEREPYLARDLDFLLELAIQEQNDSLVQAVLARQLTLAATPQEKGQLLVQALQRLVTARPARTAAVGALLAQFQASADQAAQVAVHDVMRWSYEMGGKRFWMADTGHVWQEAEHILALNGTKDCGGSTECYEAAYHAFKDLIQRAMLEHPDSVPALVGRMLRRLHAINPAIPQADSAATMANDVVIRSYGQGLRVDIVPSWWAVVTGRQPGILAPPLSADFWFPVPGHTTGDTVFPRPNKVSLVLAMTEVEGIDIESDMKQGYYNGDGQFKNGEGRKIAFITDAVRRYQQEYGSGIEITVVYVIHEYKTYAASAELAARARWLLQNFLQLPVTVAVEVVPTTRWLPPPDGRRAEEGPIHHINEYMKAISDSKEGCWQGCSAVIDNDGRVVATFGEIDGQFGGVDEVLRVLFTHPMGSLFEQDLEIPIQ